MAHGLNLARRPFIDTRPVNVAVGILALAVLILSTIAVKTVLGYFAGSRKTREAIASLKEETASLEEARKAALARLSRFDLEEMHAEAEDANLIAHQRSFSWTRFLDRLEKTLPPDTRVAAISLARGARGPARPEARVEAPATVSFQVELTLVSRNPNGLAQAIRAFYASPWFDRPAPRSEERGDKRAPDGRKIQLGVLYRDAAAVR